MERFCGVLIEHFAGKFPTWLAPTQVHVITISEKHTAWGEEVVTALKLAGVRVEADMSDATIGKKIRTHRKMQPSYMVIIGDEEVDAYVKKFDNITLDEKIHFELWGGEPFLYWKTLKPLVIKLREKFPSSTFSVITNGSMFNDEIIDWIVKYDVRISISHDGPGQPTRGPDPFDDIEKKKMIMKLVNKRATALNADGEPEAKISFNSMVHKHNDSRGDIAKWFLNKVGMIMIGEGGTVDAYDEGGKNMSWSTPEEHIGYRKKAISEIISYKTRSFNIQQQKIDNFPLSNTS